VAQKPGGVTVATTATAPRVPNKFTYNAGTIQSFEGFMAAVAEWDEQQVTAKEATYEEPAVEDEEEEEDDGNGGKRKRRKSHR